MSETRNSHRNWFRRHYYISTFLVFAAITATLVLVFPDNDPDTSLVALLIVWPIVVGFIAMIAAWFVVYTFRFIGCVFRVIVALLTGKPVNERDAEQVAMGAMAWVLGLYGPGSR